MSEHKHSVEEAWTLAQRGLLSPDEAKQALDRAVVEIAVLKLSMQAQKHTHVTAVHQYEWELKRLADRITGLKAELQQVRAAAERSTQADDER